MTNKQPRGRPSKYPADWTESQRVAARTRERKDAGWTNPKFWLAPGFDRARLDKYIARENKRALKTLGDVGEKPCSK